MLPLSSIFNRINGRNQTLTHSMRPLTKEINYPGHSGKSQVTASDYQSILDELHNKLKSISLQEEYINSLLSILECCFSFMPSSSYSEDVSDISLYDHLKITASVGSCISEYLQDSGTVDYRKELLVNRDAFLNKKTFVMLSGDFSGIQSYIFNIVPEGALRRLRSRSFFLEIMMEHIVDGILSSCGVSRANLIYSGGGHCYILLPNTEQVIQNIEKKKKRINDWLRENFGTKLFYACAYIECSANDLMNIPVSEAPYEQIYRELSRKLSRQKLHRYTAKELMELNEASQAPGSRECRICGTEANLCAGDNICQWCNNFGRLSSALLDKELIITVSDRELENRSFLPFPTDSGEEYYYFTDEEDAKELLGGGLVKKFYTKNKPNPEFLNSTNLYMGDYVYDTHFDELVDKDGYNKLAVLRADVDNLGQAFISGFTRQSDNAKEKNRYSTFSRTATFSRQMSMFFKFYLNSILEGKEGSFAIDGSDTAARKKVVTVYSGGDDLFLIGNIRDILEAAVTIRTTFDQYTSGSLSITFGIGIYPVRYPLYNSAFETAKLEETAKLKEGKNSITLFTSKEDHTYYFDEFVSRVIGEKYRLVRDFFEFETEEQERGSAFLFNILKLLEDSSDRINIARYAYILARMEPKAGNNEYKSIYRNFSKKMYSWILNPKDRKELITAIYIYNYLSKKGVKNDYV
jgi:CRISPR-associated protein Csm1